MLKLDMLKIELTAIKPIPTADDWKEFGLSYDLARDGKEQDYENAHLCYLEALKLNPIHQSANYLLGLNKLYASGDAKNLEVLKKYLENAATNGYSPSKLELLKMEMAKTNPTPTPFDWNTLGVKYAKQAGATKQDREKANLCYFEALKIDSRDKDANYNLGVIYQDGRGVVKDLKKSKEYFEKAVEMGDADSKNRLVEIERLMETAAAEEKPLEPVDPAQAALVEAQKKLNMVETRKKVLEDTLEAEKKAAQLAEENLILQRKIEPIVLQRIEAITESAKITQRQVELETQQAIAKSALAKAELALLQEERAHEAILKSIQAEKDRPAREARESEQLRNDLLQQLDDHLQKLESNSHSHNPVTRLTAIAKEKENLKKHRVIQSAINALSAINDPASKAPLIFEAALKDTKNNGWNNDVLSDLISQVKKCLATSTGTTIANNPVVGIVVSEASPVVQLPPAARSTPLPVIVERMEEPRPPVVARPASPHIGSTAFFSVNMPVVPAHPLPEVNQSTSVKKECPSAA